MSIETEVECLVGDCTRRTKLGNMCKRHLKMYLGLAIRPSELPVVGIGLGLFTTIDRVAGENLCVYDGKIITTPNYEGPYVLQTHKNPPRFIDSAETCSSNARFANAPRGSKKRSNAQLIFDALNGIAWLRSKTTIKAGQEIICGYGSGYWRKKKAVKGSREAPIDLT